MPFMPSFREDADARSIFGAKPEYFEHFAQGNQIVMRGPSPLTIAEREFLAAFCSAVNQCPYCHGGHAAAADILGVDSAIYEDLLESIDEADVEEKMKPLLKFVKKLTETPERMVQADADAVYAAGWEEQALYDAILICCMFAFNNRLTLGHGLGDYPERHAERGRRHIEVGYLNQHSYLAGGDPADNRPSWEVEKDQKA